MENTAIKLAIESWTKIIEGLGKSNSPQLIIVTFLHNNLGCIPLVDFNKAIEDLTSNAAEDNAMYDTLVSIVLNVCSECGASKLIDELNELTTAKTRSEYFSRVDLKVEDDLQAVLLVYRLYHDKIWENLDEIAKYISGTGRDVRRQKSGN